jgi:hypothetical protein
MGWPASGTPFAEGSPSCVARDETEGDVSDGRFRVCSAICAWSRVADDAGTGVVRGDGGHAGVGV